MANPGTDIERQAPVAGGGPKNCRRCDLWRHATQAIEGEGPAGARIMLVGEQPGDEEDSSGHPFTGPAGRLLGQIMAAVGMRRDEVYMTNAVKHFKWESRGGRRLHNKPTAAEVVACNIWLEGEITAVKPSAIVALGATALQALGAADLTIDAARRQSLKHPGGARLLATYHPSAILRGEGPRAGQLRRHLEGALREAARLASRDVR